jgi:hypothetical protein
MYLKIKCIGKELGLIIYSETRARSMQGHHNVSNTLINQLLIFVLVTKKLLCHAKYKFIQNIMATKQKPKYTLNNPINIR